MRKTIASPRGRVPGALGALIALSLGPAPAAAGVIQKVEVSVSGASNSDSVFGVTSLDITTPILATITNGNPPPGQPRGTATGSVGPFGDLGVSLLAFGAFDPASPDPVSAKVLIGSDEFVNLTGRPATLRASAIIDGGSALLDANNMEVTYQLFLGAANLGVAPLLADAFDTEFSAGFAAHGLGTTGPSLRGAATQAGGIFRRDGAGNLTWNPLLDNFSRPFPDLGATVDPPFRLEIPLSFQTFDLSEDVFGNPFIISPGERVMLGYEFELTISPTAFTAAEGLGATYSDPLRLSGNPRFTIQFQPVSAAAPEPGSLALLGAGALLLMGCRSRGRPRDDARKQT